MPNEIIKISQEEFDNLKLTNNNVAIEIVHRNSDDKTKSGLIIVQDASMIVANSIESAEQYDTSQHLDRWGIVAKLPDKLIYAKNKKRFGMDWDTDIEIQVGDYVWADYYNLHHCPIFKTETKSYWIVTYDCLIVAKRESSLDVGRLLNPLVSFQEKDNKIWEIIPLNGYCLFNQINEGLQSKFLILDEKINKSIGITRFVGSKNREYNAPKKYDDIDIRPGDKVIFRTEANCLLENSQHRFFADEDLRYEQRWNIMGVEYVDNN